ncbi:hypothetical protein [Pseudactinotalea sp.]|uniref:hypothetical protein n=1 Tax=Pseudactinotalea sp. TaxID=1926260 RepID=UPI003B3A2DD7
MSDEWFEAFIEDAEQNPVRRRRVLRERIRALPVKDTLARVFQDKTDELIKYLRGERERHLREQERIA